MTALLATAAGMCIVAWISVGVMCIRRELHELRAEMQKVHWVLSEAAQQQQCTFTHRGDFLNPYNTFDTPEKFEASLTSAKKG